MYVHEALQVRLLADADVTAITENISRGYLGQTPNYPAAVYRSPDEDRLDETLDEFNAIGLRRLEFTFFSTANKATGGIDAADELDRAIRACLEGFVGTITDADASPDESVDIQGIFHVGKFDFYDDKTETSQVVSRYDVYAITN